MNPFETYMRLMQLSLDSQVVITERLSRLVSGHPGAEQEAVKMIEEKVIAAGRAMINASMGGHWEETLADLETRVEANKTRLTGR